MAATRIGLLNLNLIYKTLWTGAGNGSLMFSAGRTQLVLFDWSNNTGAIAIKMLGLTFSFKLHWGSYIITIALPPRKVEP